MKDLTDKFQVRRVRVVHLTSLKQVQNVDVVFVSRHVSAERVRRILALAEGHSVLTVGETPEFAKAGGCLNFDTVQGKIRLRMNHDAMKKQRVTLDPRLQRPVR